MRIYTSHIRPGEVPILVPEGFSWGAAFLGWIWLLWWRAWIAAILLLALNILLWRAEASTLTGAISIGLFILQGLFGRDIVRWGLDRSGYTAGPVVAGPNHDGALLRLLSERADLIPSATGLAR